MRVTLYCYATRYKGHFQHPISTRLPFNPTRFLHERQPFAWEAREFLRKKCIGKQVAFKTLGSSGGGREYAFVYLGQENLNESVVKNGFANVKVSPTGSRPSGYRLSETVMRDLSALERRNDPYFVLQSLVTRRSFLSVKSLRSSKNWACSAEMPLRLRTHLFLRSLPGETRCVRGSVTIHQHN